MIIIIIIMIVISIITTLLLLLFHHYRLGVKMWYKFDIGLLIHIQFPMVRSINSI